MATLEEELTLLLKQNPFVRIESHFGTYLTACEDQESIRLQQLDGKHQNTPRNTLWKVELVKRSNKTKFRFLSCYGKYLAVKPKVVLSKWRTILELYQTQFSFDFTRENFGEWEMERVIAASTSALHIRHSPFLYLEAHPNGAITILENYFGAWDQKPITPQINWHIHSLSKTCPAPCLGITAPHMDHLPYEFGAGPVIWKYCPNVVMFNHHSSSSQEAAAGCRSNYNSGQNTNTGAGTQNNGDVNVHYECGRYGDVNIWFK